MSTSENTTVSTHDDAPPGFEPWLGVMVLAFVPALLILVLPAEWSDDALLPLSLVVAAIFSVGLWMYVRDHRKRRVPKP